MTFDEYQKAALRTASMNLGPDLEMCIRALGLAGETVELCDSMGTGDEAETKEAGDVLWYAATLASSFGLSGADLGLDHLAWADHIEVDRGFAGLNLIKSSGQLAEMVKKQVGHKKPADRAKVVRAIKMVIDALRVLAPVSLTEVAEINVAKLKARYPAGFDLATASTKPDSDDAAARLNHQGPVK